MLLHTHTISALMELVQETVCVVTHVSHSTAVCVVVGCFRLTFCPILFSNNSEVSLSTPRLQLFTIHPVLYFLSLFLLQYSFYSKCV